MSEIDELEAYESGPVPSTAKSTRHRQAGLKYWKLVKARRDEAAQINNRRKREMQAGHRPEPSLPRLKFLERAD